MINSHPDAIKFGFMFYGSCDAFYDPFFVFLVLISFWDMHKASTIKLLSILVNISEMLWLRSLKFFKS